jgi:hypothetical protein
MPGIARGVCNLPRIRALIEVSGRGIIEYVLRLLYRACLAHVLYPTPIDNPATQIPNE